RLQARIAEALSPFVKPERRRFEPHLTLARVKAYPPPALGRALAELARPGGEAPQPWHAGHFALLQSTLDSGGSRHTVLRVFACGEI
ncbi:MAG: 2'-5' RNA ligase family protein, partial [Chthoniobacteraceae bacterium]|nr:2'-5' RNA ligase family protein [Chthoniobacteraceae bacterium]